MSTTVEAVIFDQELIEEREYWIERLSRETIAPNFVWDHQAKGVYERETDIVDIDLPEQVDWKLNRLSGGSSFLLNAALMASLKLCLHKYTGRRTIAVGSPALKELDVANAVAIVDEVDEQVSFRQLLLTVRQTLLDAYARQRYPIASLLQDLGLESRGGECPLFDVSLRLEELHGEMPGLNSDISIVFNTRFETISGSIEFDSNLFDRDTVERFAAHFVNILRQALDDPEAPLNELDILTETDRSKLLVEWNDTEASIDESCIPELIQAQVERTPDAIAAVFQGHHLTYRGLNDKANQLAHYLQSLGVGPEVRVALCLERSLEMVIGILGVVKSGGAYIPLDPTYPADRLAFILEDSQPAVLLTQERLQEEIPSTWAQVVCMDSDWDEVSGHSSENPQNNILPQNLAYAIYTSGSTGMPKAVLVEHVGVPNLARVEIERLGLEPESHVLQFASISFDASVWEIFATFLAGASLVLESSEMLMPGAGFIKTLRENAVTTVTLPPSLLGAMDPQELPALKAIVVAGDACTQEVVAAWSRGRTMIDAYGPTECTVCASMSDPMSDSRKPDIGKPIANTQIYLLDRELKPVVIGAAGEMFLGGRGLARGYLNRPELTAERFVPNAFSDQPGARLYRTGDLARYLGDGRIDYLGRTDHQVKIRGFRIELQEIEAVLRQLPEIRDAVVVTRESAGGSQQLVAYVVPEKDALLTASALRAKVKEKVPEYMTPSAFVTMESLPLNLNGKIDRRALPDPDRARLGSEDEFAEPRSETEKILAEIWANALAIERVGINDNFFEIGGDSIIAIQIIARANAAGLKLTAEQIFKHQTIAGIAEVVGKASGTESEQGTVSGPVPLTPIQHWFFEQDFPERHHYNQAVLLEVSPAPETRVVEQVVRRVFLQHDALRLGFEQHHSGWTQFNADAESETPFVYLDLSHLPEESRASAMEEEIERLQSSFDLNEGSLLRVAMFGMGENAAARLFIAIHHLAVDGVSWRILIEDFDTAFQQASRGEEITLPAKTTSFKQWAESLVEYSNSERLNRQRDYWKANSRIEARSLPTDHPEGVNSLASARKLTVSLSVDETEALLREAPKAYRTQIGDLLLTALAQTFQSWTGQSALPVDLEAHGREEIIENVDLSRTVGWFTSLYPVVLSLEGSTSTGDGLKAIKEQLRSIPDRGIGYGLLRFLSDDDQIREELRSAPQPEVSFNYLGQFDPILSRSSMFKPAAESSGPSQSANGTRSHLLEINSSIAAGRLQVTWTYSENVHLRSTIEHLAEEFRSALCSLIAHCQSQETVGFTPSDFPLAKLSQRELDQLAGRYDDIEDIYPLTAFQKGLLFHTLLSPDSRVYFAQLQCRINSALDISAFEQSWRKVIARHAVLRTSFVWEGSEEPVQVVHENINLPWAVLDWRGLSQAEQKERLKSFLEADQQRGLNLAEAPLMRVTLARLGDAEYEFIWTFHHLLLDGWALYLVIKELFAFYDALSHGKELRMPEGPAFREYVEWLQEQDLAAGETFWKSIVKGITAPTPLGDRLVTSEQDEAEHAEQKIWLSAETTAELQALARQHGLTMNTLVQAAWAIVLSFDSGERQVVFGTTVSGRPGALKGVESIIGPFINTLPVRVDVQPRAAILPWLRDIQAQQIEGRRYEYTPLVQIQGWSDVERGKSLFDSLLLFENFPVDASVKQEGSKLRISEVVSFDRANYPLSVFAMPGEELSLRMAYDKRRFEDSTITRMLGHCQAALEGLLVHAESRIGDLEVMTATERNQLLVEWNDTGKEFPTGQCIHAMFEAQAASAPDRVAVVFNDRQLTYNELNSRANQLAHHLIGLGIKAEERVAICIDRSLEMVIGLLAILKAGGAYVPIDPDYPLERVSYMLEDAQTPVIVTKEAQLDELPALWAQPVCLDSDWEAIAQEPVDNPDCATSPENVAYIIYTSGSTGTPKGVLVTHATLVNSTSARFDYYNPVDSFILLSSFAFDSSVVGIFWTLCQGGALVLPDENGQKDPHNVVGLICREQASHLLTVPSYYTQLLAHAGPAHFRSLDTAIIAGESWPKELVGRHVQLNPNTRIYNEYGPTEGTVWSSVFEAEHGDKRTTVPIGRPIANVRIYILDEHLNPVPVGVPGQLYLGGSGLARGYFNHPELTASKFVPGPFGDKPGERLYCTGDLARFLPDGNIDFLGRIDQQVKVRGYRIELEEIEAVLTQMPSVFEAVVVAREDVPGEKRLVAYVVLVDGQEPSVGEFRSFLDQKLPAYMVPSAFVFLDELPLTPNGKVDRRALPAPDQSRPKLESAFAEPRSDVERVLAEIWSKVLHVEKVGINDNFFELGGDSILSIQLLSKAREQGLNLSLQQVFRLQTIAQLAGELTDAEANAGEVLLTKAFDLISEQDRLKLPDDIEDAYPLSMLQTGMIFHSELNSDSAVYHSINSARLRGPLDVQILRTAAQRVIDRHVSLRTSFHMSGFSVPLQFVHRKADAILEVEDLRALSQADQEKAFAEWLEAEKLRHFDWDRPPLLRMHVHQWSDDTFQFTFTAHHAVIDGWSDSLFLTELFRLYLSFLRGWSDSPQAPPTATFRDYVALERQALDSEECQRYWADKLADSTMITLPRRPGGQQSADAIPYRRLDVSLPDHVSEGLWELAHSMGVPLKSVFLAAHLRVMSVIGGQQDVITGLVSNGRSESADGDQVIGLFLNTLPLRQELSGGTWTDLIKETFENETEMLPYRRYPLAKIQRDVGGRALFENCFNFVHFPLFKSIQESREIEVLSTNGVAETNYPLITHFAVGVSSSELGVFLDCDLRQISEQQMDRIGGYYVRVFEAMVSGPMERYESYSLLSAEERRLLLEDWNDTKSEFPQDLCIHELFEAQVRRTPSEIAASCEGRKLTYLDLNRRANRVARALVAQGAGPDFIVPLLAERGLDFLTAVLGVFKSGGAYLPLDPMHPDARLMQILQQSGARLLLASAEFEPRLSAMLQSIPSSERPELLVIERIIERALSGSDLPARSKPRDLAYVIFTSGSTGLPKGAMIEHVGMLNHLYAKISGLGLTDADVVAQTASQTFDISVWQLLSALLVGGRVEIFRDDIAHDASRLLDEIRAQGVTIVEMVPSLLRAMLDATAGERRELPLLRWMVATGEALPADLCRNWLSAYPHIPMLNAYGPTECSDDVTHYSVAEPGLADVSRVPIGQPLANTLIYIVDEWLSPVPVGVIGELCVGGIGVGRGYLNDEARTNESFVENPFAEKTGARLYKTGDLARYLPDGNIDFLGRKDHQVKVRGFRIELQEIEEALRAEEAIKEVAVLARGENADKRLVAYIVWEGEAEITTVELRNRLAQRLPDYMVPRAYVVLDEMPLTANRKIDRRSLPDVDRSQARNEGEEFVAPRTETEALLAGIWGEVLGVEEVGIHDNFFELGGHSLLAIQVISRIRHAFNLDLPLRTLFEHPSVARLSRQLESRKRVESGSSMPSLLPIDHASSPGALVIPASFAQQRLWVLGQLDPGSAAYNIPAAVRISGLLDVATLQKALNEVGSRHASLRTTFADIDGEPVQVIASAPELALNLIDLSDLDREQAEAAVSSLADEEARTGFDLQKGPLVRATLLRLAEDDHVALFTMHHIISDGWSRGILIQEMAVLYDAFSRGKESPLPELPIQYPDYAVWQRQWLEGDELDRQLGFWKRQLGGMEGVLELPTDRPRGAVQSLRGARQEVQYSRELAEGLKRLSRREGATLYMVLLAAFHSLLHRYSGQSQIPVGTPIAGRAHTEIEGLIGFFVNTLVMKADLSKDLTFLELLKQGRDAALEAYAHQDLPFEKLVEELNPSRSLSYTPIFQVMFALQNAPVSSVQLTDLTMSSLDVYSGSAKFDLTVEMTEAESGLVASWEYAADLFDASTIARMQGHFGALLEAIVADPNRAISELPLLTDAEKNLITVEWNRASGSVHPEKSIHEMFEEQVELMPDAIALVFDEERLSYRELNRRANRLAWYLKKHGVGPEVLVGICLERSLETVVGLLGILKAGGAYLPLNPSDPEQRLEFMLKSSGAQLLITHSSLGGRLASTDVRSICIDLCRSEIMEEADRNPAPPDLSNLAYTLYTSGSTGVPKGVAIQHRSATALSNWTSEFFGREKLDGVLGSTSLGFDLSVFELLVTLSLGGKIVLAENALQLGALPCAMEVSLLNTVPSVMTELIRSSAVPASVRTINLAGEQLPRELINALHEQDPLVDVINLYGPSEDTTYSTYALMKRGDEGLPPIGRPLAGSQVYILDGGMSPAPVGVKGEIYIGGLGQARGYLNRPDLTAERFIPDPLCEAAGGRLYKTGDLGRYRPDGEIEFLGRKDHQVKVRGFRIELQEIEEALRAEEAIKEVAVLARGENADKRLVAYIVWEGEAAMTTAELRSRLAQRLPDYMVPRAYVVLDEMPLTANRKIDRRSLPDVDQAHSFSREEEFAAPRTATEELVAGIWGEVLGVEEVGIHDNFFELGGHSLLATQVVSRLRACFKVEVALRSLFEFPTLSALAESIDRAIGNREGAMAPALVPVSRDQDLPLSFAQQRLWLVDQVLSGEPVYNMPFAVRFNGKLNAFALAQAMQEIVQRHESLRTNFAMQDGRLVQIIHPAQPVSLPSIDLSKLPGTKKQAEVERLIQEEAQYPFDLAHSPLLRATLVHLDDEDNVILCSMHHIVSDGWSIGVLVKEMAALYEAVSNGLPSPLPALPIQYADFAHWQQNWLRGEVLEGHLNYWKQQLGDTPPVLQLPTDRPRVSASTYDSARRSCSIPVESSDALKAISRREEVTMFMTLFAAFQTLLYRRTNQDDIMLGTAIANRNRAETETLIGCFVNLLALRTDLSGNPTFRELLGKVREVALGAYAHQDLPFERLVQELQPDRDPSVSPLLPVVFVYQNAPAEELNLPGASLSLMNIEKGKSQFDIIMSMTEVEEGLAAVISYRTDLFYDSTIERLASQFRTLLSEIAENPDKRISDYRLITEDESQGLVPSHFPKARLSQKDFENFLSEINEASIA